MNKKLLLIDLDGVLNKYNGEFNKDFIPKIREGASDLLDKLSKIYDIKIFTSRSKSVTEKWLEENDLKQYVSDVTNIKEPAYLYIDDRCICFNGNYKVLINQIKKFKVYWND